MNTQPFFSLLIANYNSSPFIHTAIDSALRQTYKNMEIIVIDDCSTDDSAQLLQHLSESHPTLVFKSNDKNYGVGYTKQRLVNISQGDLFGFLDPDDCLIDNAVEMMVRAHASRSDVGVMHSLQENCDQNLCSLGKQSGTPLDNENSLLVRGGSLSHFCTFKKTYYDRTKGIGPHFRLAEDIDLYLKMEEVATIGFVPDVLYKYRIHTGGISQGKDDRVYFWYTLARYDACVRRGIDPESLLFNELRQQYAAIGFSKAIREVIRSSNAYLTGKGRGLKARIGVS